MTPRMMKRKTAAQYCDLSAVMDCYEEAYRAGAGRVLASYRAGEVG